MGLRKRGGGAGVRGGGLPSPQPSHCQRVLPRGSSRAAEVWEGAREEKNPWEKVREGRQGEPTERGHGKPIYRWRELGKGQKECDGEGTSRARQDPSRKEQNLHGQKRPQRSAEASWRRSRPANGRASRAAADRQASCPQARPKEVGAAAEAALVARLRPRAPGGSGPPWARVSLPPATPHSTWRCGPLPQDPASSPTAVPATRGQSSAVKAPRPEVALTRSLRLGVRSCARDGDAGSAPGLGSSRTGGHRAAEKEKANALQASPARGHEACSRAARCLPLRFPAWQRRERSGARAPIAASTRLPGSPPPAQLPASPTPAPYVPRWLWKGLAASSACTPNLSSSPAAAAAAAAGAAPLGPGGSVRISSIMKLR